MRKLLAILLTCGVVAVVVMASMDRRPGLWQRATAAETAESVVEITPDSLSESTPQDTTNVASAADSVAVAQDDTTEVTL
ncbi:MAG: hypothetical protein IJ014_06155 [Rikenellaceae bacterium]|nr:hypothetical protein [Rikenellaceae bacterium]